MLSSGRLLLKPHILKPLLIMLVFNIFQVFCGLRLFTFYAVDIISKIREGKTQLMDDYSTTILISGLRTLTTFVTCFLTFWVSRRQLGICSGISSFVFATCLGIMLLVENKTGGAVMQGDVDSYLTLILLILYVVSMSFGFGVLPGLMLGETQSSSMRGFSCGFIYAMNELILGGVLKIYPWLALRIYGLFLMFGIFCGGCTIFVYFFLPETQGKTLQDIEEYFRQPNILWITRRGNVKVKEENEGFNNSPTTNLLINPNI